ncbi:MAG: uncharacterized protein PWP10_4212 [Clostridiales bacterium]|jgi:uncharacterized protein YsxB (DUF464 family)|nr:uncharacterized protein [Clostridiales bacterium]
MITVNIYRQKDGLIRRFEARGHAGLAASGHDIICAAVSAIAQTIIGSLEDIAGIKPQYSLEDGDISCDTGEYTAMTDKQKDAASVLMQSMEVGCLQISVSYGSKYVQVKKYKL